MSVDSGYAPGVWHRLLAAGMPVAQETSSSRLALDDLKASVAHDLENLLNTRVALRRSTLARYPRCRKSVLNYGLMDFAAYCLTSSEDRATVCQLVKLAIERFEPRLKQLSVTLCKASDSTNRIDFRITAVLSAPTPHAIAFNALLQPSNLRYSVRPTIHGTPPPEELL